MSVAIEHSDEKHMYQELIDYNKLLIAPINLLLNSTASFIPPSRVLLHIEAATSMVPVMKESESKRNWGVSKDRVGA